MCRPQPASDQLSNDRSVCRALHLASFLERRFYGRSRVPSLSALLQRECSPVAPLPFRRDDLLVQPPKWFETHVAKWKRYLELWMEQQVTLVQMAEMERELAHLQRELERLEGTDAARENRQ